MILFLGKYSELEIQNIFKHGIFTFKTNFNCNFKCKLKNVNYNVNKTRKVLKPENNGWQSWQLKLKLNITACL